MAQVRITSISNVRWVGMSQLARLVVQLASVTIFSRLLAPSDYGLLAMATVVTTFGNVFQNMGTSRALIQKQAPTGQLLDTVFWFNVVLGLVLGAIIAATSHLASLAFREPRLQHVLLMLAFIFPIIATGTTHLALMERASRFRSIAWVEISSSGLGFGLALIAAWCSFGVYSLVLQTLITAAISTILFWFYSGWRPSWRWDQKEIYSISHFSGNLLAFNIVNYLANSVDSMLVGHFLGAANLGWYNMAFGIMLLPIQNVTNVLNRALLPVYARQNPSDIGRQYLKAVSLLALVVSPIVLGLWSLRDPLVEIVLGDKWMPVADVLTWFGPLAWLECLLSSTGVVLISAGRTDVIRNIGLFSSLLFVISFVLGFPFGIVGIAKVYFFADLFLFFIIFHLVLKTVNMRMSDLSKNIWRPAAIGWFMGAIIIIADNWLAIAQTQAWLRLVLLVPAGAAFYLALVALFLPESLALLRQVALEPHNNIKVAP
jgi:O-antigen/teichoic acid export membrane protein